MTQVIQQVNLNLIPQIFGANSVLVPCSQYDKSYRVIQFNVYNGRELYSIPSTCTVLIRGTKKDLTGFEYNCEFSGSQVIFPLEPQITVLSGKVPAELRIVNGEELIGSANFLFMVEPSPLTDDTIISETQLPLLEEALQAAAEAEQSKILAEAAKESAEDSAMSASDSSQSASQSAVNASLSEANALQSATNASQSEQNAKESEELAQGYSQDTQGYASNASDSAQSASQSAQSAQASAQHAEEVVEGIEDYVNEAKSYAEQSSVNAQNASVSASNALTSENNAHTSELNAKASEDNAKQSETNASASATSASQSATSASQSATNSANSATQSAQSATQASQSATNAQNSATSAEESSTEAQEILDNIDSLIENKADNDGIYPNMSVGSAEKLLTSETVDDQFTYQTLKHDGYARINSIHGNTLVWNQQIDSSLYIAGTYSSVAVTKSTDETYLIANGTASGNAYIKLFSARIPTISGHKYCCIVPTDLNVAYYDDSATRQYNGQTSSFVFTANGVALNAYARINSGVASTNRRLSFMMFDLTAMGLDSLTVDQFRSLYPLGYYQHDTGSLLSFNGSGIKVTGFNLWDEEWEQGGITAQGVPQSSTNRIRSKNFCTLIGGRTYYATCGKTDGGNQNRYYLALFFYDENQEFISYSWANNLTVVAPSNASYFKITTNSSVVVYGGTYNHDICINLSSNKNGTYEPYITSTLELPISQYFPNGMKSAGDVFDELTSKKAIVRIGAVDLGTLTWSYETTSAFFYADLSQVKRPSSWNEIINAVCVLYQSVSGNTLATSGSDMCLSGNPSRSQIRIKNSSYTDATAFKNAMSNQILYFELATYEETDIDLDLTYKVENGGTEQLLPINSSVPVTSPLSRNVSFFYDSNVVANLLTLLSSVAQVETSPTTHAYAVGDYLIYNYQLYRVTSAIAVGGTLTVGTNIVATTLVAIINS